MCIYTCDAIHTKRVECSRGGFKRTNIDFRRNNIHQQTIIIIVIVMITMFHVICTSTHTRAHTQTHARNILAFLWWIMLVAHFRSAHFQNKGTTHFRRSNRTPFISMLSTIIFGFDYLESAATFQTRKWKSTKHMTSNPKSSASVFYFNYSYWHTIQINSQFHPNGMKLLQMSSSLCECVLQLLMCVVIG